MKKYFGLFILVLLVSLSLFLAFFPAILDERQNVVVEHQPYEISPQAQELHSSLLVGDWHADSLLWMRNLSEEYDYGHLDFPRMQQGNLGLQMFTTVTKSPSGQNYELNQTDASDNITLLAMAQRWPTATWTSLAERALFQADKLHKLAAHDPENLMLVRSRIELAEFLQRRQSNPTLIGGLLGTEGSHALDGDLANIQRLYNRGFRMMSLQHFFDNKLGGSLHGTSGAGLTQFGRDAVTEMLRLGIMLDMSHSSEQVVRDTLALSDKPLIVSHTGFQGHCDSPRNISDGLMEQIAAAGGLIAVGFWDGAICGNSPATVAEAIVYGIGLVGEDHIALGSDFDGSVTTSLDGSELAAITQALLKANLNEQQIRKVMGENMLVYLQTYLF
ncbi:dipeptidase [SAR92 clade bacterium H455]|uniref:Dipeptidase n=1 Tax=SAR92 clade bacterium H455 TaxID=2974818 RepID=A0ABY5TSL9_9GAMM|nr:dipeptidase [SAR92 clade bacterium H455]